MANNSMQETIYSRVTGIIHDHTGEDMELTPETDLLNDLAIDSIELIELGIAVEKEFGERLAIAALRRCTTIGDLVQLILQTTSVEEVPSV